MIEIKKENNKFYVGEDEQDIIAEITFVEKDKKLIIDHTFVDEELRGQGIALQLVNKVVEYARQKNFKVVPLCSYARKVMTESEEYKDVFIGE